MRGMIPVTPEKVWPPPPRRATRAVIAVGSLAAMSLAAAALAAASEPPPENAAAAAGIAAPPDMASPDKPAKCLPTGDGYLRAHLAGAVDAKVNWANAGTRCDGEIRDTPLGVRLSFHRIPAGSPDLLFVFGLTGVAEGRAAHEVGANLTVIVQGTDRIYGTLGDSRCTVDSLSQRRLAQTRRYRVEARGFCTQPAHAVRGDGEVLVSTFEFAGLVDYEVAKDETVFPHGDPAPAATAPLPEK
jgi:hypothetical protein